MRASLIILFAGIIYLPFTACKQKKKNTLSEKFFPALPYIKSQVAHVDTSLYSIRKIVFVDSARNDTTYIRRENFREIAADFLNIPDISASQYEERYTEDKQFDETLNRVLLVYTPVKPEKEEVQREEILIQPDPSGDKITTIIINTVASKKDSVIEKKMLWQVDQSFQVTTISQAKDGPETVSTYRVIWNESETE
jgi:hypothetical protein